PRGPAAGSPAGGPAGGSPSAGSTPAGSTAGGSTAGGSTAGGTAGGSTAGGTAGGSTAGGSAGGSTMMAGETCGTAPTIMAGTINGTTMGAMNDVRFATLNGCAGSNSAAPDVYYAISVPAQNRLSVNINATWDTVINLIEEPSSNCGSTLMDGGLGYACVAGADAIGSNETVTYANTTAAARTVYIHVDGWDATDLGAFTLAVTVTPIPAGDVCGTAAVLTLPASLMGQTLVGFAGDYLSSAGCASGSGSSDRAYRVSVPAGNRLTATATASVNPDGGVSFAPTVNIVGTPTCAANLFCVAGGNSSTTPGTATATFDNPGAARDVFVVIDTATTPPGGTFSLFVSAAPVSLLSGDVCSNTAAPITMSQTLQNETFVGYNDQYFSSFQAVCRYVVGVDRAYAVTIPAGQILTATAIGTDAGVLPDGGTLNLALSVILPANECQSGPCVSGADSTTVPGGAEVVSRNNTGTADETVLVVVDSNLVTPSPGATYSLALNLAAPLVGDTCSDSQTAITASTSRMDTLTGYSPDYSGGTSCALASGADRVYRITIPAGFTLTATTSTTADHGLSLVDGPASSCSPVGTCLARADANLSGTMPVLETLSFNNTTMAPRTVFLIVDRFGTSGSADYALTIDLSMTPVAPYTKTTIMGSCDTLSSPTVLLDSTTMPALSDETVSATTALPFAFNYFGAPVTHFAAESNGLLQILDSMGTGITDFSNDSIPAAGTPNNYISAYWDDQEERGATSAIRFQVFGTAPNRYVTVEWSEMQLWNASTTTLTYQVKLFETSNVVEMHYCTLTGVSGSSATVGIENAMGNAGVLHSYNTAMSVNTMTGLRYTP
ncbi:MAG: hypothetical protein JNJ54_37425, partial [Myxococcaceae bacterium]|nr:hypothetical protein [Myxococcaceae bacterium]